MVPKCWSVDWMRWNYPRSLQNTDSWALPLEILTPWVLVEPRNFFSTSGLDASGGHPDMKRLAGVVQKTSSQTEAQIYLPTLPSRSGLA